MTRVLKTREANEGRGREGKPECNVDRNWKPAVVGPAARRSRTLYPMVKTDGLALSVSRKQFIEGTNLDGTTTPNIRGFVSVLRE